MMKSKKILALVVTLALVFNLFAGLSLTSSAATPAWVWYPATHGYCAPGNIASAVDNTAENYTTFTVSNVDGHAYPGKEAAGKLFCGGEYSNSAPLSIESGYGSPY